MSQAKEKLGILLFSGPHSQDVGTVAGLAEAAMRRGAEVEIFMMYEAVLNSLSDRLKKLCEDGLKVTLCSHNADELSAEKYNRFIYGSQYDNSHLASEATRYIAFT